MSKTRGVRGATVADENTRESILTATTDLLEALVTANDINVDDIAAAYFTTTSDLNAEFPAAAARQIGWEHIALLCSHEMNVPYAMGNVIRVLLLVDTEKSAQELNFQYLKGTDKLRRRTMDGSN